MLKILHLISTNGLYGAERVIIELSRGLKKKYNVFPIIGVISNGRQVGIEILDEAKIHSIDTITFFPRSQFDLTTVRAIRHFISKNKIDIVHCHGYKSNFYGILSSIKNVPLVTTNHNWLRSNSKLILYCFLDSLWIRFFDRIIAVSNDIKEEMVKHFISPEKIMIIDNGMDFGRFTNSPDIDIIKSQLGITENIKVIGTIGSLNHVKGHVYLLKAAANIIRKNRSVKIIIVGDGPLINNLNELAMDLGIRDEVIFTGYRKNIPELLSVMDIFVLPSITEGLPMVLLEAMAAGKPVIASNVGAIHKIISNNETGILVPPKNVIMLEVAISSLLNDDTKARNLAVAGSERVRRDFSSEKMCGNYLGVYISLVEKLTSPLDASG